jgi:hypothetical protein
MTKKKPNDKKPDPPRTSAEVRADERDDGKTTLERLADLTRRIVSVPKGETDFAEDKKKPPAR